MSTVTLDFELGTHEFLPGVFEDSLLASLFGGDGLDITFLEFTANLDQIGISAPFFGWNSPSFSIAQALDNVPGWSFEDGVWTLSEPSNFTPQPGLQLKPALDFGISAGLEIGPSTLGRLDSFDMPLAIDFNLPDSFTPGSSFQFGVNSVSTSAWELSATGLSLGEGFFGLTTRRGDIGLEEVTITRSIASDIAINAETMADAGLGGIPWPLFPGAESDIRNGLEFGGDIDVRNEGSIANLRYEVGFRTGQSETATGTALQDIGLEIRDRVVELSGDVSDLIALWLPGVRVLSGDIGPFEASFLGVTAGLEAGYTLLDYTLSAGVDFVQSFAFTPDISFEFRIGGETFVGGVGDTFSYTPDQDGPLDMEVAVNLGGELSKMFALEPVLSGALSLLEFELNPRVAGWGFTPNVPDWNFNFLQDTELGQQIDKALSFETAPFGPLSLGTLTDSIAPTTSSLGFTIHSGPEDDTPGGSFGGGVRSLGQLAATSEFTSTSAAAAFGLQTFFGLGPAQGVENVAYTGAGEAAFLTDDFRVEPLWPGLPTYDLGAGIMLSSGGFPGTANTDSSFTVNHGQPGDPDLTATAQAAFAGAGVTNDASVLEFTIEVTDPAVNILRAELMFGSEEFPVFIDSSFVDIAALYVNGVNYALFDDDPNRPLSVIRPNVNEGWILNNNNGNGLFADPGDWDGGAAPYAIEWNGFSAPLTVRAPLQQGLNTVRIGVADTGDFALDSGLFVGNLELVGGGGGGGGVLSTVDATSLTEVAPTTLAEEIILGGAPSMIIGTPQTLNNDVIVNFSPLDKLVFSGVQFLLDQVTITAGSAILDIDTSLDGEKDTQVTLVGVDPQSTFFATVDGDNTVITYETLTTGIEGTAAGTVIEDDADSRVVGGMLALTNPPPGIEGFQPVPPAALQGIYGSFTFDATTGAWTYTLDNERSAVQSLAEGQEVTDALEVASLDGSASQTITVTVIGTNDAPVSSPNAFEITTGTVFSVPASDGVLLNDMDIDGDALVAQLVAGPMSGTLTLNENGSFVYTPDEGFTGVDSFVYRAFDGIAAGDDTTVTITVLPEGVLPELVPPLDPTPPPEVPDDTLPASPPEPPEPLVLEDAPAVAIAGRVLDAGGNPVPGLPLQHSEAGEVVVGADGRFEFALPGAAPGLLTVSGKAPAGTLSMDDGMAVLRAAMGLAQPDGFEFIAADVNRDGVVDGADAQAIFRHVAGLDADGDPGGFALIDANADFTSAQLGNTGYQGGVMVDPSDGDIDLSLVVLTLGQVDQFAFA